jgi:hypothetical protein
MKLRRIAGLSSVLCLSALLAQGQDASKTDDLEKKLKDMQDNFDRVQREQRQQIEDLRKELDQLKKEKAAEAEKKKLADQLAAEMQGNKTPATPASPTPAPAAVAAPTTWSPDQPITIARAGSAYMNISFDTLMDFGWSTASDPSRYLELGDHDPIKRGFSLRNAEITVDGAVDPYFKGFGNIVLKLDRDNGTEIELEEAYLITTTLPANLQFKAGQFFANFGRQNSQHPHQWAFVDEPLMLTRAFGPDGLRNVGGQLSWLLPTPFFTEASLGVFNPEGGTAFSFENRGDPDLAGIDRFHGRATLSRELRGPGDLLLAPRLSTSFDVTDSQTLVLGASAAFGPNDTGRDRHTQVYGADIYWKWKPANAHAGFPFVSWQTEGLFQRYEAGADLAAALPAETLQDYGFYSQVLWGFKPRWVAALRGEFVTGNDAVFDSQDVFRGERTRISPNITFYPSEFSKIRLQYNYDHGQFFGDEHSVWLQMEFLLGAHGAHKF